MVHHYQPNLLLQLKVLFQKLPQSGLVLFVRRRLENFVLNQGAEITLSESAFLNEIKEQKLDFKIISLMVMHGIRADPSTHISPLPPPPCDSGLQDYLTNFLGPNMLERGKFTAQ